MKSTHIAVLGALLLGGCTHHGAFVVPARGIMVRDIPWTQEEEKKEIAVVEVRRGNWSSEHVIRLAGSEKPHIHERHDAVVTLLHGRVRMHLGDQEFEMRAGDVVSIPHGMVHWAQNEVTGGASEAYAVFSPPYDGTDSTPVQK